MAPGSSVVGATPLNGENTAITVSIADLDGPEQNDPPSTVAGTEASGEDDTTRSHARHVLEEFEGFLGYPPPPIPDRLIGTPRNIQKRTVDSEHAHYYTTEM